MKKWLTVTLVVAFIVVAVLIVKNRRATKQEPQLECPDFSPQYLGQDSISSEGFDMERTVTLGDYGAEVAYVQERLNTQYGASVDVDGKFGCETWFALQAFTGLDGSEPIDLNDLK